MNTDPLNDAGWAFVREANELSIPLDGVLWNNLKRCLRPAIIAYLESVVKNELIEGESRESHV